MWTLRWFVIFIQWWKGDIRPVHTISVQSSYICYWCSSHQQHAKPKDTVWAGTLFDVSIDIQNYHFTSVFISMLWLTHIDYHLVYGPTVSINLLVELWAQVTGHDNYTGSIIIANDLVGVALCVLTDIFFVLFHLA